VAALASLDDRRGGRRVTTDKQGRTIERGASSAVDLLARLGRIPPPAPHPAIWMAVEPTGDPIVDLRHELQAARTAGVPFEAAWRAARARIASRLRHRGRFGGERNEFMAATGATQAAWADAYRRTGARLYAVEALRDITPD
jgi:hypothetical protein